MECDPVSWMWIVDLDGILVFSSRGGRGSWIGSWITRPFMPPAEIDPFILPGVIQHRAPPISVEDVSSDDEMADSWLARGAKAALHQRAAVAAPASAARGKPARGGRGGKSPKAAGHVLAAPLAVPRGSAPKRGSPLRAATRDHQLREDPAPSMRRRSLSGHVSAALAAASSAASPSGAARLPATRWSKCLRRGCKERRLCRCTCRFVARRLRRSRFAGRYRFDGSSHATHSSL